MASTSGTVSTYPYDQRKVIEHSFRRAGRTPESATAEELEIAQDLLYTTLAEWTAAGFPLWTRQFALLGGQIGSTDMTCPAGTAAVISSYWRQFNPYRGPATLSSGASGANLFAGAVVADTTIVGAGPSVTVGFGTATEVDTVGILPGGSATVIAAVQLQTSPDGSTWTTVAALPSTTFAPGQWAYFDLTPALFPTFLRLLWPSAITSLTLNQLQLGLANGTETTVGPLNIDQYWSLPNKYMQGNRVTSTFVDRQVSVPVLKIWPVMNAEAFFGGTVSVLTKRYIQDPGTLVNNVEVPQRGLEALQWSLAAALIDELPESKTSGGDTGGQMAYFALMAKNQKLQRIDQKKAAALALFWAEERAAGPIQLTTNFSCYTK